MLLLNRKESAYCRGLLKNLHFNMLLLNHDQFAQKRPIPKKFTFQYASIKPFDGTRLTASYLPFTFQLAHHCPNLYSNLHQ